MTRGYRRVFMGGLSDRVRRHDVERFFRRYGKITEIVLRGSFGFVEFESSRDAEDAVEELSGRELGGERVVLEFAKTGGRRSGRGYGPPVRTKHRLVVRNLSSGVSWQDLKDLMRRAGDVTFTDVHQSVKGEGVVEFENRADLRRAIEKYDGYEWHGRKLQVREASASRSRSRSRSRRRSRTRSRSRRRSRSRSRRRSRSRSSQLNGRRRSGSQRRSESPAQRRSPSPARRSRSDSGDRRRSGSGDRRRSGSSERRGRSAGSRSSERSPPQKRPRAEAGDEGGDGGRRSGSRSRSRDSKSGSRSNSRASGSKSRSRSRSSGGRSRSGSARARNGGDS